MDPEFEALQTASRNASDRFERYGFWSSYTRVARYGLAGYAIFQAGMAFQDRTHYSIIACITSAALTAGAQKIHSYTSAMLPHLELEAVELQRAIDRQIDIDPELDQ